MKTKLMLIAMVCTLIGCSKEMCHPAVDEPIKATSSHIILPKISKDTRKLTSDDAIKVANLFSNGQVITKSECPKLTIGVVPIKNDSGRVLMYAVNYIDGYTIVSATKDYYPILAEIEHGTYTGENTNTGLDVILREYMILIEAAISGEIKITGNPWSVYEEVVPEYSVKTKVSDDYYETADRYMEDWYMEGYNIYLLSQQPENMPDELYEQFCDYAADYNRPDHNYMTCSFIVENPEGFRSDYGPLCKTYWHQNSPYNQALDNPNAKVGCGTIAIAQILRALRTPAYYDWDSMPNYMSPTSSMEPYENFAFFIRDVRSKIGCSNGYADIEIDIKNGLIRNYGFNVTVDNHNSDRVESSIRAGKPVCMRGQDRSTNSGHIWVCDGYRYTITSTEFSLYTIPLGVQQISELTKVHSEIVYEYPYLSNEYFHMNWGQPDSRYNGYYLNNNVSVAGYDFSIDRKNLYFN